MVKLYTRLVALLSVSFLALFGTRASGLATITFDFSMVSDALVALAAALVLVAALIVSAAVTVYGILAAIVFGKKLYKRMSA